MARRIGLVGCVKKKLRSPAPACELYVSPLFLGRRSFVERSCDEWWILSALHGLVDPQQTLAPYNVTLKDAGRAERRRWSRAVLEQVDALLKPGPEVVIEVHAGAEYRDFGLVDGLRRRGCTVVIPAEGLGFGQQLRFYMRAGQPDS